MATTNKVTGWTGVLMTEGSSSHWPTKRRHVYYETSRRAGLEFVCVFGHDAQASFTTEASAVALLFGLVASGQIRLRRIDGYQHVADVLARGEVAA